MRGLVSEKCANGKLLRASTFISAKSVRESAPK
jgi:hypothetical protein